MSSLLRPLPPYMTDLGDGGLLDWDSDNRPLLDIGSTHDDYDDDDEHSSAEGGEPMYRTMSEYFQLAPRAYVSSIGQEFCDLVTLAWLRRIRESVGELLRSKAVWWRFLRSRPVVAIACAFVLVLSGVLNQFFFELTVRRFEFFLAPLSMLVQLANLLVLASLLAIAVAARKVDLRRQHIRWQVVAFLAFLQAIIMIFMVVGGSNVSGPVQVILLSDLGFPMVSIMTWVFSFGFWRLLVGRTLIRFDWHMLFVAGIVFIYMSQFAMNIFRFTEMSQSNHAANSTVFGVFFIGLAVIFSSAFVVITEMCFEANKELDALYLWFYLQVWIVIWTPLIYMVQMLLPPRFGGLGPTLNSLPSDMWHFLQCLGGVPSNSMEQCDLSSTLVFVAFVVANTLFNLSVYVMIKFGSAVSMEMFSVLQSPLLSILLAFEFFVPADMYQPLTWNSGVSSFFVLVGFSICVLSYIVGWQRN